MISDLHNDAIVELNKNEFIKYIVEAEQSNVKSIFLSVWTSKVKNSIEEIGKHFDVIKNIKSKIDLKLHIEDAHFLNMKNIDRLIELKPYSIGLTWNYKNKLAAGAFANARLSRLGKTMVETLEENNIQIDLAHLNERSFYDVANISNKPLLCTHTCFDEINIHQRNLNYNQIKLIEESKGLIGFTLVPKFLNGTNKATYDDILKHINYFLDNFDENILAIGTDFFGSDYLPKNLNSYKHFDNLKTYLKNNGLTEETIDKIFYKNVENFCKLNIK